MKNHHFYAKHSHELRQRLNHALDRGELRDLHMVRPARHFLVVARLLLVVTKTAVQVQLM